MSQHEVIRQTDRKMADMSDFAHVSRHNRNHLQTTDGSNMTDTERWMIRFEIRWNQHEDEVVMMTHQVCKKLLSVKVSGSKPADSDWTCKRMWTDSDRTSFKDPARTTIKQIEVHLKKDAALTSSLRTNSTLGNEVAPLMNLPPRPDGSFWWRWPGVMAAIIRLITSTLDRCGDSATG